MEEISIRMQKFKWRRDGIQFNQKQATSISKRMNCEVKKRRGFIKEAFDRELASNIVNGPTCRPKSSYFV